MLSVNIITADNGYKKQLADNLRNLWFCNANNYQFTINYYRTK